MTRNIQIKNSSVRWPGPRITGKYFVVYISFIKKVGKGPRRKMTAEGSSTRLGVVMGGLYGIQIYFYRDFVDRHGSKNTQQKHVFGNE